jgi:hypothetical protein
MPEIIAFPFTFIGKTGLGTIYRPYAVVAAYSKARQKWQPVEMIVDSGADYTLFPKKYAAILGIDLGQECTVETTLGVGGAESVYQYKKLPVKIGNWQKKIPVGFLERNDVPPLLGRLECLEVFHLHFKNKQSIFEL